MAANPDELALGRGLSPRAFRGLATRIHAYCGISLSPEKHTLVANRLRRRVQALGLASFDDYCELLATAADESELEILIDLVTTNHTVFLRETEHFRFLADRILPLLGRELARAGAALRLWSAASSSGEEPYTMAMVAAEARRRAPELRWRILGSDISRSMLAAAERGIYRLDGLQALPADWLQRYFLKGVRSQDGYARVVPELRQDVRFARINLLERAYPLGELQHVIFCRNVMIYFDAPTRAAVVGRLVQHLQPGGYLFVGYSESLAGLDHGLEAVGHGIYRRP
ncbi:MAG: CheR family methyltransferase [Gammaproteobacteria bacterium]